MRPAVLFILLCATKRTLATCSQTATSFSSKSTSKFYTTFSTGTEIETTTFTTPGPEETKPPKEEPGGDAGGGGDFPVGFPWLTGIPPFLFPTYALGLLPLAGLGGLIFVPDFDNAWNRSHGNASATVSYLIS